MENAPKVKLYPLDQLYLVRFNKKPTVSILVEGQKSHFVDVFSGNIYNSLDSGFEIVSSFLEALKENNLDILLTDSDGTQKQQLSLAKITDLLKLLERKRTLNQVMEQRNHIISNNMSNIVSDLLGLNISNPSTPFRFSERLGTQEVIVPAKKLVLFKKSLLEYIKASLLVEPSLIITYGKDGQDYRVARSLRKAKIIQTEQMKNNAFSVNVSREGRLRVNDIDINEYQRKTESGFQKTFKF